MDGVNNSDINVMEKRSLLCLNIVLKSVQHPNVSHGHLLYVSVHVYVLMFSDRQIILLLSLNVSR